MESITKVKRNILTGFVKELGGPATCQRCIETPGAIDLIYIQTMKNNPAPILTVVKFTNGEAEYKCLVCRDGEDRDFSEKFNNFVKENSDKIDL